MRIAHIITGLGIGGAEYMLKDLAHEFAKRGHEQKIFYIHQGPLAAQMPVAIKRVSSYSLLRELRAFNPEVIYSSLWRANMLAIVAGKILGIPVVAALHNNAQLDGKIRTIANRYMLPWAHARVAVSHEVAQSYRAFLSGRRSCPVEIIENGICLETTDRYKKDLSMTRSDIFLSDEHFVLGAVGRLETVKGFDRLIRIVARMQPLLPQLRLVLVGSGSQEKALRQLAMQLDIHNSIHFTGAQDAMRYYALFDCFAQTSHTEGLSRALLEAMSFSLPCVILHNEVTHCVIEHEKDGLLAGNEEAFMHYVRMLYEHKNIRTDMGDAARGKVMNRYALNTIVNSYERLGQQC